jgi:NADH:ubiquinone oxidoreductase subunit F (NADH-binding)
MDDLTHMERLARMVQRTSLCGLGQGAPNPIFSTLRFFRDEYLAHIVDHVCPAGVCTMQEAGVPA